MAFTGICFSIQSKFILTSNQSLFFQSIIDTDDFSVIISSTKTLCEIVNNFLSRISEIVISDDELNIKCDILR